MIKRILTIFMALTIAISANIYTFASNLDEIRDSIKEPTVTESTESTSSDNTDEGEASGDNTGVAPDLSNQPTFLRPADYLYAMFDQIVDLYVKEHLYEFTREEALEKLIYDMIEDKPVYFDFILNTLLGTMDRYSSLQNGSTYGAAGLQAGGYGIVVNDNGEAVIIKEVMEGSKAAEAGILPGDKIVSVMGYDVTHIDWNAISFMLKNPHVFASKKTEGGMYENYNPEITLGVERNGETIVFNLIKGTVVNSELSLSYFEEEKVAYIQITSFSASDLAEKFKTLLDKIKANGYSKLVIDLRDNGGGSLDLVMEMAENFVEAGETMCYFNSKNLEKPEAVISDTPKIEFDSISVLINEHTASAAELMASILKTKCNAYLIGDTTFGKALGQTVYTLATGDYITITTYEVLDANGESYNEIGLVPDIAIDNVEMYYELPKLMHFNHTNYKTILPGVYNDACMALEQRLELMGILRHSAADGIWDDSTKLAVYLFQRSYDIESDGTLDDLTVRVITNVINSYKDDTFFEDSQLDVAIICHSSFSQGKRLAAEKKTLAEEQQKLIKEREERMEAEIAAKDAENGNS